MFDSQASESLRLEQCPEHSIIFESDAQTLNKGGNVIVPLTMHAVALMSSRALSKVCL